MKKLTVAFALVVFLLSHSGRAASAAIDASSVSGGLVLQIGCRDTELLIGLGAADGYVVQGLDTSVEVVAKARRAVRETGSYGPVSVKVFDGEELPFAGDVVNLIVMDGSDQGCRVSEDEIRRVLAPRGVLATTGNAVVDGLQVTQHGDWRIYREPVPADIDDWTHFLHESRGTSVSLDALAGHPRGLKWTGGPFWARSHEHTAGMNAMVSAEGRVFYVMDEGPVESIQLPAKHMLVARDAFSGVVLWKRAMPDWWNHLYPLKSGPTWLPRRLVAVGDRVYATPGAGHDLLCLDAATGETVAAYADTATPFELIVSNGVVLVAVDADREPCDYKQENPDCWKERSRASAKWQWTPETGQRILKAIRAETGDVMWTLESPITPISLAADGEIVCFHDGTSLVALELGSGSQLWKTQVAPMKRAQTGYGGPRLVIEGDKVLFAPMGTMSALSRSTGEVLWTVAKKPRSGHFSLEDFYVLGNKVWVLQRTNKGAFSTYDLATGAKLEDHVNPIPSFYIHQRCYPGRATVNYQLPPMMGIQVYDMGKDEWTNNHWVRGGCIYGVMPANGMVYATPHACACYYQSKLNGFNALGPEPAESEAPPAAQRLTRGPAYGRPREAVAARTDAWPVFRHDSRRSGYAKTDIPADISPSWRKEIGGKLSQAVVCDGVLYVSVVDGHTVHALDAGSGQERWVFVADGRVDSPPALHRGLAVFGCADGSIYAVDAADGVLAWRFRGAPTGRQIVSYGQPESVWPISGSVLIQDDRLYCVAGRSMFLDGGLRMIILNPVTGELISENVMDDRVPGTDGRKLADLLSGKHMPVAMPDILSSDGRHVYMKSQTFGMDGRRTRIKPQRPDTQYGDEVHLFSPVGFLDDAWHQRTYWIYGRAAGEGWAEFQYPPKRVPCGRILCIDEKNAYSYGRDPELLCNTSVSEYRLFSASRIPTRQVGVPRLEGKWEPSGLQTPKAKLLAANSVNWRALSKLPPEKLTALDYNWIEEEPTVMARAMVLTNDHLFIAGPRDVTDEKGMWGRSNEDAYRTGMAEQASWSAGAHGSVLQVFGKGDGKQVAETRLDDMPVFDGLIAAEGRLFMSSTSGAVVCLGSGAGR